MTNIATWTRCECCEDFWCNLHGVHAYDCDCPPLEDWETDPYGLQQDGPAALQALPHQTPTV